MAGLRGNQAYWLLGKQPKKGEAGTAFTDMFYFTDGNISPSRGTDQLSETDASRDAGDFYVTQTGSEGSPSAYVRDASVHHLLEAALGTAAHEGTTNYTHKISGAAALPYYTLGKAQGGVLFEQFNDCKVDELTLAWDTAGPGTASLSVQGRGAIRGASEFGASNEELLKAALPTPSTAAPLNFNKATVKIGGVETRLVSSFNLTISNNVTVQQTDDAIPYDIVEGQRVVTLGFDYIIEDLKEYNKFNYGGESGKTQSADIYVTENLTFEFAGSSANNSLKLVIPKTAYTEFPVEPDAGGAPTVASVAGAAQRSSEGFVQATVKNQIAT